VKVFALEGSPNVPHAINIAQFTQISAEYLCDGSDQVYAPFITAVSLASYKPEQTAPTVD
jgi:hypothetical protein